MDQKQFFEKMVCASIRDAATIRDVGTCTIYKSMTTKVKSNNLTSTIYVFSMDIIELKHV